MFDENWIAASKARGDSLGRAVRREYGPLVLIRSHTSILLEREALMKKALQDEIKAEKRRNRLSWVSWLWRR